MHMLQSEKLTWRICLSYGQTCFLVFWFSGFLHEYDLIPLIWWLLIEYWLNMCNEHFLNHRQRLCEEGTNENKYISACWSLVHTLVNQTYGYGHYHTHSSFLLQIIDHELSFHFPLLLFNQIKNHFLYNTKCFFSELFQRKKKEWLFAILLSLSTTNKRCTCNGEGWLQETTTYIVYMSWID